MFKCHIIKRSLVATAAIAAVGFPPIAQARTVQPNPDEQVAAAPSGATAHPLVRPNPDEQVAPSSTSITPTIVRVSSPDGGFDWGDAGIGAAGSTVLLGAGLLGAGMTRRRRTQRPAVS
jgi:hypothetical protein